LPLLFTPESLFFTPEMKTAHPASCDLTRSLLLPSSALPFPMNPQGNHWPEHQHHKDHCEGA
jgi:hypothetical protein